MKDKVKIDDCCFILDSMRIPINSEERFKIKGDIPYYGANGVQGYINDYIFNEDLILLAEDGGNFEAYQDRPIAYRISGKSWVNNHAHILKAKPEYIQDFVFYSIVHKNIISYIHGGTRSKLNQSELKEIEINYFEKPHQQKIAKILNTIDVVIEKTEHAIAKYQAIKKGMMHDLFTRGIDIKTGQLRPSFDDAPELYKESTLGMIPKGWEETKLGNKGSFRKGNNIPKYNLSNSGKSCVLYGQIYTSYDDLVETFDSRIPEKLSKGMSVLKKGDILFAGSGETHEDIGKCITYIGNDEVYPGGDIVILSLFKNNHPSFFGYYLNHESIQKQKAKLGQGSSVIHIYRGHLEVIDISIPQLDEQIEISERLIRIDKLIKKEEQNLSKHQKIKKGLMQDLLTGKVEVKV